MIAKFRFSDWPLRVKLGVLLIAASLLPLSVSAWFEIRGTRARLQAHAGELLAARGDQLANELEGFHQGYRHAADALARVPQVVALSSANASQREALVAPALDVIEALAASDPGIRGVGVLDAAGRVVAASEPAMRGRDLGFRSYVREAIARGAVISDLHFALPEANGVPTIAYLAPITPGRAERSGFSVVWVRAAALWELAKTANELAGPRSFAVIFDQYGVRIAHTYSRDIVFHPGGALEPAAIETFVREQRFGANTRALLDDVRAFPEQFQRARAEQTDRGVFVGFAPVNQRVNLGVARRLSSVPWTVFYMVPEAVINAQIAAVTKGKAIVAVAITSAALLVGALFASMLLARIRSLSEAMRALARGEHGTRAELVGNDEIGSLAAGFNAMADRLQAQVETVRETHDELERTVQTRTAALMRTTEDLQREVGERARAQQLLAESEQNLAITLRSIGDAVIATDAEGRVIRMNPVAEELTGFRFEEAEGKQLTQVFRAVNEDTGEPLESPVTRVLREGVVIGLANHTLLIAKDGVPRAIADSGAPIKDARGVMHGVVLIFRDQSADRVRERALSQSEARKGAILEAAIDSIVTINHQGAVVEFNSAAERTFGYERAQVVGKPLSELIVPPSLRERHTAAFERYLKTGEARILGRRIQIEAMRSDGSEFPVELTIVRIRSEGEPMFTAYIKDLTEQHRTAQALEHSEAEREREFAGRERAEVALRETEEQLRQAQKMEAIGTLAGGVAHDFNNLLTVILSYVEMLMADLSPGDPMHADLDEVARAGQRAKELTRQLLAFSRRQVLQPKSVDLNDAVRAMGKMLERVIGEDVELTVKPGRGISHVRVDPGQFEQVLMNLVVNARDAMPRGGKLTIETAELEFDREFADTHLGVKPGRYVVLRVSDSGEGMDRATQLRIFEPFFTTKPQGKGTGLGLSTAFGIVQQSGGSIWVESELGRGSTFNVYLPRDESAPRKSDPSSLPPSTLGGSETILLVEDDEQVRHLARSILRRQGYHVLEAATGGDALLICEQHKGRIDLMLADVVMPRMSGRELAERLSPLRPEMRVLFMSGYTDDAIVHHGVLSSDLAFIQKPLTPARLLAALRETLDAK